MKITPAQYKALVNKIESNLKLIKQGAVEGTLKSKEFKATPLAKARAVYEKAWDKVEEAEKVRQAASKAYLTEAKKVMGSEYIGNSITDFEHKVVPAYLGIKPITRQAIEDEVALISLTEIGDVDDFVAKITAKFLPEK